MSPGWWTGPLPDGAIDFRGKLSKSKIVRARERGEGRGSMGERQREGESGTRKEESRVELSISVITVVFVENYTVSTIS